MIVLFKHRLWILEMTYLLFQNLQKHNPSQDVHLEELTGSTYKEQMEAPLNEITVVWTYENQKL